MSVVNPYLIPGTDCLKNKLGITDAATLIIAERQITGVAMAKLKRDPVNGQLDYQHLKDIHRSLFERVYEWAGDERTVQTSKGFSNFEYPNRIGSQSAKLFTQLSDEKFLKNLEPNDFIKRAAHFFSELNVIHPFPEGNGRAQRVLFEQIAIGAGYEFTWDTVEKKQFIEAVVHSYAVDSSGPQ